VPVCAVQDCATGRLIDDGCVESWFGKDCLACVNFCQSAAIPSARAGPILDEDSADSEAESRTDDSSFSDGPCAASFALCREFIQGAVVDKRVAGENHVFVNVNLNERGRTDFETFTARWMASKVCITVDDQVILRAPVRAVIDSGRIVLPANDPGSAARLARTIIESSRGLCGEVPLDAGGR
jgi:hypothetical protein